GGLRLFGCDRIRGVSGFPRQLLFARGVTERAPDRHSPPAWPLDSAVGVEASFAGHFTCTLLVWIGSVHGLALGYSRLPTQPCVCFVKLVRRPCSLMVSSFSVSRSDRDTAHANICGPAF